MPKLAAIIVQYNNWHDTILCLESVLQSTVLPRWVIVVDNASTNDAVEAIGNWAFGALIPSPPNLTLLPPPLLKPYPLSVTTPDEATACIAAHGDSGAPHLLLVRNSTNGGYGSGNNVGLRIGLNAGADAFWILNNDTIVTPDACGALASRLFACQKPGLVGGLLCYMAAPDMVQCRAGGYTDARFFLSRMNGHALFVGEAQRENPRETEKHLNFIYGACVMASRNFVETVGLMDERLFLYCEEQDWSWGAKGRFDLAYASDALVFHREGGSTGMSKLRRPWRRLGLLARNKLLVSWKHHAWLVPTVCLGIIFSFFKLMVYEKFLRQKGEATVNKPTAVASSKNSR